MAQPRCKVCKKSLTAAQVAIAASRGQKAKYCSATCRETAKKRRQRDPNPNTKETDR